ncbi:hypothetical protein PsYK624_089000 [Phanerochaete sordida]|uniref:Uncharacterized protein n=1 Tax=Phanerochaete sordida TaxID=48140 RepID=A0A9P3GE93_9APHY|nr:hypothetical protein PsYK624_089000 [Phanerochaete sordida]
MSFPARIVKELASSYSPLARATIQLVKQLDKSTANAALARGRSSLHEAVSDIVQSQEVMTDGECTELLEQVELISGEGDIIDSALRSLVDSGITKQVLRLKERCKLWAKVEAFEANAQSLLVKVKTITTRRQSTWLRHRKSIASALSDIACEKPISDRFAFCGRPVGQGLSISLNTCESCSIWVI